MEEIQEKGLFQGSTREERVKVGQIKQVVFFLCHQGIEIRERSKTSDRMSKGMTASLDLVLIANTYVMSSCMCARESYNVLNQIQKVERDRLPSNSATIAFFKS